MDKDPQALIALVMQTIYDKKGINSIALDVRGISTITDYIIIAEGNVDRHVIAMAKAIEESTVENLKEAPIYIEGLQNGDWIVLDYLHVMIHLFTPGLREKYQLERLWSEGKVLDIPINTTSFASRPYSN